ncbi:MAG: FABP family protein [Jatrophihabitantaceae bacterium]
MSAVPPITDTDDLRSGPEIHQSLLAVLALVGNWAGHGTGLQPATDDEFSYAQRVSFHHDGRPFLAYQSRSWLLNPDGSVLRPAFRENGFLRIGAGPDELELVLADAAGLVEIFTGVSGDQRWEIATSAVGNTPSAKQIYGERRLYAITDDDDGEALAYVQELALEPAQFRPHLNARLLRV